MTIERTFRILSYAAVLCGFLSLWVTGTFGLIGTGLFIGVVLLAWRIEDTRWQVSERLGTALIVLALPAYYLLWKYRFFDFASTEEALPGMLARLILSLTAIKLLQRKSDRDWIFLYVMAFFQVLLAAGMSISALYLGSLVVFVLVMLTTIVVFESRRTAASIEELENFRTGSPVSSGVSARKLPVIAATLLTAIVVIAIPTFFFLPRVGGAGIGAGEGGVSTATGFSDTVRLGNFGRITQSDEVVMRVRLDAMPEDISEIKWRGIALDIFDNRSWRRSRPALRNVFERRGADVIQLDSAGNREKLLLQTFYAEPIDATALFNLPRAVAVQAPVPFVHRDVHDSFFFQRSGERNSYRVLSDISRPDLEVLRRDFARYPAGIGNYLQLPDDIDGRIVELAAEVTEGATNRYDAARMIEGYLQTEFGYTLEMKAGGDNPLADFLFNVREGHCEYFATAMAVMLRTQGIATRVVNGFQRGEYNETADVFVVRQRDAHSWVEVYFPGEDVWVSFDPTPAAGQTGEAAAGGFTQSMRKYFEALEMLWIQYFVAFDSQEQRSLFASARKNISEANQAANSWLTSAYTALQEWWRNFRGDSGLAGTAYAIGVGAGVLLSTAMTVYFVIFLFRRLRKSRFWSRFSSRLRREKQGDMVEFYARMQRILAEKGMIRAQDQTPLEFAYALGDPDVKNITEAYNRARYGSAELTSDENAAVEDSIARLEAERSFPPTSK
ncbi:MAG: DUF3488 domain-containing protein [Acidobacteria bacterium]|nr:DUF3488 domain-containing protein [Acidobacteriota bacterium]